MPTGHHSPSQHTQPPEGDHRRAILPPALLIVGPTAGGKTALALALAAAAPGAGLPPVEIISADSMLVYRGMDIGTAKPTPAERAAAPHHLIDILDPREPFSVDRWLALAEDAFADIRRRGHWPVIVGGTHLYAKAFLEGLFEGPPPDPALRRELDASPAADLRAELQRIDPAAAARIHANDRRRTIRAIEVFRQTGVPISEHQAQWDSGKARTDVRLVGLEWPTDLINRRINARVKEMFTRGLEAEARALFDADQFGPQSREALGYKQLIEHFQGRETLSDTVERIKIETRRMAKNQRTWLKRLRQTPGSIWLEMGDEAADAYSQSLAKTVFMSVIATE